MLFLDSSALLKRYVEEDGTSVVLELMDRDPDWVASALARTETEVTLCHLEMTDDARELILSRVRRDWERIHVVPVDQACLREAADIGCARHVRTLDAVHLAAARRLPEGARFVTFDRRQATAAAALGLATGGLATKPPRQRRQR